MSQKEKILKNTFLFTGIGLISRLIAIPKNIIIGLVLLPSEYGLYNSVFVWFQYLTMLNIGLCSAVGRESAYYFGQKDKEKIGIEIQNKSIIIDFTIALAVTLVYFVYVLNKHSNSSKGYFFLVGIAYLLNKVTGYYDRFNSSRNLFPGIAKANFLQNILGPIFIIIAVFNFKIYALFLAPIIVEVAKISYYYKTMPLNFSFNFKFSEMKQFFYSGLFFGVASLLSTFYFVIDRTFINLYLDNTIMGLYSFSLMFVTMIYTLFTNLQSISLYVIDNNSAALNKDDFLRKASAYVVHILISAIALILTAQLCYYGLVNYVLVNYRDSAAIFTITSPMIFFYALYIIPSSLLSSKLMQKERVITLIMVIGVLCCIAFNVLFLNLGLKGEGVALSLVISQAIIAFLTLSFFYRYSQGVNLKQLIEIVSLSLLLIFHSGYFYYLIINHYSLNIFIFFTLAVFGILYGIIWLYFKINPLSIAIDLLLLLKKNLKLRKEIKGSI